MIERKLAGELKDAIDTSNVKLKWQSDPRGYFTIKPFFSQNKVFVRYYDSQNNLKWTFKGTTTLQLIQVIIKKGLVPRLEHTAYLGKEIEKAIIALEYKFKYIQDKELKLGKSPGEKRR